MSAHGFDPNTYIDAIPGRTVPSGVKVAAMVATVLGAACFVYGWVTSPVWAWGAFLVAVVYLMGISQGGVMFGVMLTLTMGRWGRPLKRVAESFGMFLPVAYVGLLIFLLGGNGIYPWHEGTISVASPVELAPHSTGAWATKETWLSLPFFIGRQAAMVGLLVVLGLLYIRTAWKPDLIRASQRLGDRSPGWWSLITGGASSVSDADLEKAESNQSTLGVFITIAYSLVFSFMAFDLIMSLSPWFYTNMFGGWFFMSSFWLSLCALGIAGLLTRDWLGARSLMRPKVFHDLGKLCLALCMFWAYTTYAQVLPIWYANMPEETDFLLVRLYLPEWAWLARTVAVLCFLTPFTVLVSRGIKKMKWPFIGILSLIMIGLFLERTLGVMPSIWFEDFPVALFAIVSVGTLIGGLGLFTLVVSTVLSQIPAVPITDEKLETHPWDVHVHSLDAAHH